MKFRTIASVICLMALVCGCAEKNVSGPCPSNLEPMYGGQEKSPECKAADETFVASVKAKAGTREQGSIEMAKLGFDYLSRGDVDTAMKRFNQAWLLDPKNCMAFNGFGVIEHTRDHDTDEAVRMFETGLALCPDNGLIKSDYGRVLEESGRLREAVSMFEQAVAQIPGNLEAYKGLIRSHIQLGNDEACLNAIHRGMEYGLPVERKLVMELERRVKQAK